MALKYFQNAQQDPFCAYRLAEIFSDPCHYNTLIQPDFQQSWIYLLFSSALTLSADPMNSKDSMKKIHETADQYLDNSSDLLLSNITFPE